MKQQRHIQTTRTLLSRFRYWGRKNYAAFASMGREFQIGHLHINVVDVALRKQNAAQTIPYHTFMTLQEIKDQVLAGIDISPDQAAWLANMADSEALYAAAHEITVTCVPSSTPSPADVRKTANGVHNPPTTRLKPRFTISFPLKNVFDRPNTTKPRTSIDSPSLPADENHLPNRLPNFAIQSTICVDIRRFNFVLLWDCSMKKNCVPCMKRESPVITVIWKLPRLIFPNSALRIRKNRNWLLSMQPVV